MKVTAAVIVLCVMKRLTVLLHVVRVYVTCMFRVSRMHFFELGLNMNLYLSS